jgi:hypothetical protein
MANQNTNDGVTLAAKGAVLIHGIIKKVDTSSNANSPVAVHIQVDANDANYKDWPVVFVDARCLMSSPDSPFDPRASHAALTGG